VVAGSGLDDVNKAVPIPGAPLIHFGLAKVGFQSSLDALQQAVDYLACKAKCKMLFSEEEKTFLTEVFESFGIGGRLTGRGEAAALTTR
jgi:hypothetical protein